MYTIYTNTHTSVSCVLAWASLSLPATFHSLVSTGKDGGFERAGKPGKEDYKCWIFYYLALKAQYAATVIISTAALFYKIVKDDETALPATELALSLVIEGSARCFIFPASVAGDEPNDVSQPTLLLCRHTWGFLYLCIPLLSLKSELQDLTLPSPNTCCHHCCTHDKHPWTQRPLVNYV